jgi:3D (Asp-Asp-Asp) domain-containing protein
MNQIANSGIHKALSTFSILALFSAGSLIAVDATTVFAEGKKKSVQSKVILPVKAEAEVDDSMELPGIFKTMPAEEAELTQKQISKGATVARTSAAELTADLSKVASLPAKRVEKKEEIVAPSKKSEKRNNPIASVVKSEAKTIIIPRQIVEKERGDFHATAYCLKGRTASGEYVRRGIVAADPKVLPIGTMVQIEAGKYSGVYKVADTGGAIRGKRIDIYVPSYSEAVTFGRKKIKVKVLGR